MFFIAVQGLMDVRFGVENSDHIPQPSGPRTLPHEVKIRAWIYGPKTLPRRH